MSRPSFRSEVFAGHLPGTRLSPRHFSQPSLTCPNPSCFQGLGLMSFPSSRNHGLETGDMRSRLAGPLGHYCKTSSSSSRFSKPQIPHPHSEGSESHSSPCFSLSCEAQAGRELQGSGVLFVIMSIIPILLKFYLGSIGF